MRHMRKEGQVVGLAVLSLVLVLAFGLAFWPVDLTRALFGVDIAPRAATGAGPDVWVPTSLMRVAGVLVASFAAMVLATWTRTILARAVFMVVGGLGALIVAIQWLDVLPFGVGLAVTVVCLLLIASGFLALPKPAPVSHAGT
jgi:hypothetical protein